MSSFVVFLALSTVTPAFAQEAELIAALRPVMFGAGHLGWLQHDFASDPTVRLRKLAEFAK